jgi:hypothetical protein
LCFTYGGYLTTFPVQQLTILETAVWLPLILFFLDRAFYRQHGLAQAILAGIAFSFAILAGHPQTAMYVAYATLAYGFFLAGTARQTQSWISKERYLLRAVALILLPLILGLLLAAVQLVPTVAFIQRSTRASLDYDSVSWGFPLAEMTHLLYPGYFGGSPQYVGIVTLVLAAAAWFVRRARREVVFWSIFGLVALLLAFGGHTFFYNLAYLLAPGFGAVRNQERIIFLFAFSVSTLAGYGALTLVQPLQHSVRKGFYRFVRGLGWVAVAFLALTALFYFGYLQALQQDVPVNMFEGLLRHHVLLLLILGGSVLLFTLRLRGRAGRGWLIALTLALIGLNLFSINWRFNLAEPVAGGPFPETGLVRFLDDEPGTFRISSAGLLPGGSSAGIVYRLEDITGNTPMRLTAFQRFEDQVGSWRRWQLLNVLYVLNQQDLAGPGLEQVYQEDDVKVYRVGDPLPRAWIVHSTAVAGDDDAIALLNAEDFDPRAVAILPPEDSELKLPEGASPGTQAAVLESEPGRLVLEISPQSDGLLVVSQPFYPGWQARVDGKPVAISRVNSILQGVPVAAGDHRVELTYRSSPWPLVVSLLAVLASLVVLLVRRR